MRDRLVDRGDLAFGDGREELPRGDAEPCAQEGERGEVGLSASFDAGEGTEADASFGCGLAQGQLPAALAEYLAQPGEIEPLHARGRTRSPYLFIPVTAGVFLSSYATTWIGIHAIFGAFVFGLVLPREPGHELAGSIRDPLVAVSTMLLPVFFIVTGLAVDIGDLTGRGGIELAVMIVVACTGKVVGSALPARLFGMSWPESAKLGVLMNTRGLTGLIILNAGIGLGILDTSMFTMMVITALVTTVITGPLLFSRTPHFLPDSRQRGAAGS